MPAVEFGGSGSEPRVLTVGARLFCRCCGHMLPDGSSVCERCELVSVPPHDRWPDVAKALLQRLTIVDEMRTEATEQARWERVLHNRIAGRRFGQILVRQAANAADCYPILLSLTEHWVALDRPTDFDTLAKLDRLTFDARRMRERMDAQLRRARRVG